MLEARAAHDMRVIGPCHIRRIEGGILAFGCDIWYDTNPFEVDMGYSWMVDLDQEADFIGKQALTRIKAEGPKRKLVGVEIDGPSLGSFIDNEMIDTFLVLERDDRRIGSVTSACHPEAREEHRVRDAPDRTRRPRQPVRGGDAPRPLRRRHGAEAVHRPDEGHPQAVMRGCVAAGGYARCKMLPAGVKMLS